MLEPFVLFHDLGHQRKAVHYVDIALLLRLAVATLKHDVCGHKADARVLVVQALRDDIERVGAVFARRLCPRCLSHSSFSMTSGTSAKRCTTSTSLFCSGLP